LTGCLPFVATDPMEWVHCHIARRPVPPGERLENVSALVSAIILKLLAKTAEDRYQTAAGVESDLRRCLVQWEAQGRIDEFQLGEHDTPDRLRIPEKLYGRAREINTLLASFDRVVESGTPELVLICGQSGIDKSSLVNELHKVLVPLRGLFASGKFDQHKRDIPYPTLAEAFQSLIRPLLGKSEAELGHWQDALRDALGPNARLIVNLAPELELIVGEQPPVPDLPPQDAQRRFQLVFWRFIGLFARPEHPLVLFFDDLQWLDVATLELLEDLLTRPDVHYLMLIGAYRDNEIDSTHPLICKLGAIRQAGTVVHEITLAPLGRDEMGPLIADSLHCEPECTVALAEFVYEKTAGNPFFAIQFLSALAEEGLLSFDHGAARWSWDLNRIHAIGYTNNVVDLMVGKLNRLPVETLDALQQLACLGNAAEITTLSIVQETSEEEVHADLWEAVRQELILRLDRSYKFIHDRVREAAYSLIPEGLRAGAHLRMGRLLAADTPPEKREEAIFEIVNALNRGAALITSRDERENLAELNLIAGKRAKASTAYASALKYLTIGAGLLPEECRERRYELAFALEYHRAECEFMTGNLTGAEQRLSLLSRRPGNLTDGAAVTCLRINLFTTLDRCDRSVQVGLEYLRSVGVNWRSHPRKDEIRQEFQRIWQQLGSRAVEEIIELPLMNDSGWQAKMNVLTTLLPPALFTDKNLFCLIVAHMANISLEHGNSDGSCLAYVWLGLLLGPHFNNYKAAFEFGQLGFDLVEKRGLDRFRARVYLDFSHVVNPWMQHARFAPALVRRAFDTANELGDLTFAAYSSCNLVSALLATGDPLADVQSEAEKQLQFARKARFGLVADIITGQLRLILALRGLTPTFSSFNGPDFDEHQFESRLEQSTGGAVAIAWYWVRKLQGRVFADDRRGAIEAAAKVAQFLWTIPSHLEVAEYHFYAALARAAYYDTASSNRQPSLLKALRAHHKQLELWAQHCSENFANRVALAAAEIARIEGREADAELLYEQAIQAARANGFVHNEALANELSGRFYAARGLEKIAYVYLRDSRYCYLRWGALGKVQQLDQRYPAIAEQRPLSATATIGAPVEQLDLETVMKASHAVSRELQLEKLIQNLMVIALEHAGAEQALLILPHGGAYQIKAEARTGRVGVEVQLQEAVVTPAALPESLLRYVIRTRESVILDDASSQNLFWKDEYIQQKCPRSVLCLPLVKQTVIIGVLYLENNLAPRVFTPKRLAMLELLASQAAISIDNAQLYADLRRSEAFLVQGQKLSHTGSWGWHVSTEEVYWSIEHFRIFNYDPETTKPSYLLLIGRVHPEDRAQVEEILNRAVRDKSDLEVNYRILLPDGSIKFLRSVGQAVGNPSGELEYIGSTIDITNLKRAEELQVAMAWEREMLAQQRATDLAKANDALRGSLDSLASVPELDDFIGQVMAAITRQLGAVSSNLRGLNAEQDRMQIELIFQDGRVMSPAESDYPERFRSNRREELSFASFDEPVTVVHLAKPEGLVVPGAMRDYLLGLGIRTLLSIPLLSRGKAYGLLSFRFAEERDFETEELEIARALATQASLAIHLSHLAKTAKQSAVLEERN
ncbi:MAG: AAA family ATPase, partial [Verrucomicrobia bacterium]|nr:AAA family ATPase [Verrucomicrobiota bacterium]